LKERVQGGDALRHYSVTEMELAVVVSDIVSAQKADNLARGEDGISKYDLIGEVPTALMGNASGSSGDGSANHRRSSKTHDVIPTYRANYDGFITATSD